MRLLVAYLVGLSLAVPVRAQDQIQIQFQTDPVLVLSGGEIQFTVLTVPDVLSMTWLYEGVTLGLFVGGSPEINDVAQFRGRVAITATQLRIASARLGDAGTYTVEVVPLASTGLTPNSRSVPLRVFDAVSGVALSVPSVATEGGNITLTCTSGGTELTFQWGKDGAAIAEDGRIAIAGGSLVINPGQRGDAGDYTCTVSNPVSALAATRRLTVFCGFL
ncbi:carcinoembryonic antigen-related cell adhesion molecule 21-like isoform X1 [Hippocampus comes]|uniref:carcinoembryonic antigen-related cell adhesion molecule 21-like isoform X1 n=1 Tax=Hippocampus comes TaxID=109280 RepID=UPI00094EECB0|nr:PREDICTED: carcinoembryonic antigen-related cell adhesion molecule 21-like isoform X1 [Hippocampus comes]